MVAPGKAIIFGEGPSFKRRTAATPALVEAIKDHIKNQGAWRTVGTEIGGGARSTTLRFGQQEFAVIFRGEGENCGLVDVFQLPKDAANFEYAVKIFKDTFTANVSRRRHA